MKLSKKIALYLPLCCLLLSSSYGETGKEYSDGHGGKIYLPLGDLSFADTALQYIPGKKAPVKRNALGELAVGPPDWTNKRKGPAASTALGCDGTLILQFTDNVLVDVEGVDLYIFEVGPDVEATKLAISNDGENWIDIGKIEGARADIDIAPYIEKGDLFYYVRLTNAGKRCSGRTPGADIDAVAAVGSAYRLSINSSVLFDVGKSDLKEAARGELDAVAGKIKAFGSIARLIIEGHTDNTGSKSTNQTLSMERAKSVWAMLSAKIGLDDDKVTLRGYADRRPVAPNISEEGRAQNRRVDIIISPERK